MWHPRRRVSSGLSRATVISGHQDIGSGEADRFTGYPERISSNIGELTGLQTDGSSWSCTGGVCPDTGTLKRTAA
jgi:hypothetical protein